MTAQPTSVSGGPIRPAGRPEDVVKLATDKPATLTGARGLLQSEPLIFELGGWDKTGVDLPEPELDGSDLGDLVRTPSPRRKQTNSPA